MLCGSPQESFVKDLLALSSSQNTKIASAALKSLDRYRRPPSGSGRMQLPGSLAERPRDRRREHRREVALRDAEDDARRHRRDDVAQHRGRERLYLIQRVCRPWCPKCFHGVFVVFKTFLARYRYVTIICSGCFHGVF